MSIRIRQKLKDAPDSSYVTIATLGDNVSSYLAEGLNSLTEYTYEVVRTVDGISSVPVIVTAITLSEQTNTSPIISLLGDNPMYVEKNQPYVEPGATVYDEQETGLQVVITGNVDTSTLGLKFRYYSATDSQGLAAETISRRIIVQDTSAKTLEFTKPATGIDISQNINTFANLTEPITIQGWFEPYLSHEEEAQTLFCIQNDKTLTGVTSDSFRIMYGDITQFAQGEVFSIVRMNNSGAADGTKDIVSGVYSNQSSDLVGKPTHWMVVIGLNQDWKLFINGVPIQLAQVDYEGIENPMRGFVSSLAPMLYAHWGTQYANGFRTGSINGKQWNMSIWTMDRSNKVLQDMTSIYTASEPGLVEQWLVNEGTGTVASGTKGNSGAVIGGAWVQASTPIIEDPTNYPVTGDEITGDTYVGGLIF